MQESMALSDCKCSVFFLYGNVVPSSVCNYGIFWSYSFSFGTFEDLSERALLVHEVNCSKMSGCFNLIVL